MLAAMFFEFVHMRFSRMEMPFKEVENIIELDAFEERVAGGE